MSYSNLGMRGESERVCFKRNMSAIYRYCCGWCRNASPIFLFLPVPDSVILDDSDDELYEPLMDDNESNAISELLVYLENVQLPCFLSWRTDC